MYRFFFRLVLAFYFFTLSFPLLADESTRPTHQVLFLALDGVPYSLMEELKLEGHFQNFQNPSEVISTFPSTTTSGFGGIFKSVGADKPLGYDEKYFSYQDDQIEGSILGGTKHSSKNYETFFDYYRKSNFQQLFMYTFPGFSEQLDLGTMKNKIWQQAHQDKYLIYIGGTDGAGHILGRERMKRLLVSLDQFLQKMLSQYERDFHQKLEVVLFSDHGFIFKKPKAISTHLIELKLEHQGYRLSKQLHSNHQVVYIPWGNISGGSFYTENASAEDVSKVITQISGIDLVAYQKNSSIWIRSHKKGGEEVAQIFFDEKNNLYKYLPLQGDPLQYKAILEKLSHDGKINPEGFAKDEDWFEASQNEYYPDALFRLKEAFVDLVQNPASILCSTQESYELGDTWTRIGAKLHLGFKGTHGGLFQGASEAFVMTNNPDQHYPPRMRYTHVLDPYKNLFKQPL